MKTIAILCLLIVFTYAIPACRQDGRCCKVAGVIAKNGFSGSQVVSTMTCIAFYESSWGSNKGPHTNPNGSKDWGLLQLNDYYWCSRSGNMKDCCCPGGCKTRTCACECNVKCETVLKDDAANVRCAKKVYDRHGFSGWSAYKSHPECKNYQAYVC